MKTKEELVSVIESIKGLDIALTIDDSNAVIHYLKQPTLNPMRIDEEGFGEIYSEYIKSLPLMPKWKDNLTFRKLLNLYNSTCKDHQVLQPLPSEMPELFDGSIDKRFYITDTVTIDDLYQEIRNHYGTPTKKELVSVEKLDEEICALHRVIMPATSKLIAQHIIDTYSLNPPKREWWMDCEKFTTKRGYTFKKSGYKIMNDGKVYLLGEKTGAFALDFCTPYIEPSIHDKVKEKLGIELYEEFMKEVKGA